MARAATFRSRVTSGPLDGAPDGRLGSGDAETGGEGTGGPSGLPDASGSGTVRMNPDLDLDLDGGDSGKQSSACDTGVLSDGACNACPLECPSGSRCVPRTGGFGCACPPGYYGVVGACRELNVVATAYDTACAIDTDGFVECWGGATPDKPNPRVTVIASSASHFVQASKYFWNGCAVRSDGDVECWGFDYGPGPVRPPRVGQSMAVQVVMGPLFACSLDTDGRPECWRHDSSPHPLASVGLPNDETLTQLAVGRSQLCGLTTAGSARCWRDSSDIGDASIGDASIGDASIGDATAGDATLGDATLRVGTVDYLQLDGGCDSFGKVAEYMCAVRRDGAVECWGGDYTNGTVITSMHEVPFRVVSAGGVWDCALNDFSGVECWQTPYDPLQPHWEPDIKPPELEFTDVSVQDSQACGRTPNGVAVCVGGIFGNTMMSVVAVNGTFGR